MQESAAPLVVAPAAPDLVTVHAHDARVVVDLHHGSVDDACDELASALDSDDGAALSLQLARLSSLSEVHTLLSFTTDDCDRAVSEVVLSAESAQVLLADVLGRAVRIEASPSAAPSSTPSLLEAALNAAVVEAPVSEAPVSEVPAADPSTEAAPSSSDDGTPPTAVDASPVIADSDISESTVSIELLEEASESEAAEDHSEKPHVDADAGAAQSADAQDDDSDVILSPDTPEDEAGATDGELPMSRPWGTTDTGDRRVLALRRTLRSGAIVRFPGDVVVFGDLNAGAQVVAEGDVVVLGKLRGLAHAGARGALDAVVLGLDIRAGQVRIADQITFPEADSTPASPSRLAQLLGRARSTPPSRPTEPAIARIVEGAIRVEDYRGRLPG